MKIFRTDQVKLIDKYTIENEPVESINLMERAAYECSFWIAGKLRNKQNIKIFAGTGNNGGDGLAIARILKNISFTTEVFVIKISDKLSPDAAQNLDLLIKENKVSVTEITSASQLPEINPDDLIVDALFGSGLSRPLEGLALEVIDYLNNKPGYKISIDIPSGLPGEGTISNQKAFKANETITFQFPFLSFLLPDNAEYVGKWHVLDINLHPQAIENAKTDFYLTHFEDIKLKNRPDFGHKGTFGHALLLVGSKGMAGAVIMSSMACLRSGCGLVTAHVPNQLVPIVQSAFIEAIISIDPSETNISALPDISKYSAIAAGPGMGTSKETISVIHQLLRSTNKPLVLDADALNIISKEKDFLNLIPKNTIITPHPAEFDRLFGKSANSYERIMKAQQSAKDLGIIIVLKGRYTCVALPDGSCNFNNSGNSGMATGGSGDVLTGIILSLLTQGYTSTEAAINGVFIHGLAGDIAKEEIGEEALIASDIINNLGKAFTKIRLSKEKEDHQKIKTSQNIW